MKRHSCPVLRWVSWVVLLTFTSQQILFAGPDYVKALDQIKRPEKTAAESLNNRVATDHSLVSPRQITSDEFLGGDSPLTRVNDGAVSSRKVVVPLAGTSLRAAALQNDGGQARVAPTETNASLISYESDAYSFEDALELIRPEFAIVLLLKLFCQELGGIPTLN